MGVDVRTCFLVELGLLMLLLGTAADEGVVLDQSNVDLGRLWWWLRKWLNLVKVACGESAGLLGLGLRSGGGCCGVDLRLKV